MSDHLVLHPQLATGNFIIKAIWLPGSQTELAIITADFVKVNFIYYQSCFPIGLIIFFTYLHITASYSWQWQQQLLMFWCLFLIDLWLVSGCSESHILLPASKFQDTWCYFPFQWRGEEHYHHHVFGRIHVHPAHGWIQQCPAWPFLCYQRIGNNSWRLESNQDLVT